MKLGEMSSTVEMLLWRGWRAIEGMLGSQAR
jgi:hypothetical protein